MSYDYFIPIGNDCTIARTLNKLKLRNMSLPFDWYPSKISFVHKCFDSKFEIYNDLFFKKLKLSKYHKNKRLKFNNEIYYYHEDIIDKEALKNKLIKRSNRLNKILNDKDKKILFIRKCKNDSINDLLKLKKIIEINYPLIEFDILLINNIKNIDKIDESIIHFFLEEESFLFYDEKDYWTFHNNKLAYEDMYNLLKNYKLTS